MVALPISFVACATICAVYVIVGVFSIVARAVVTGLILFWLGVFLVICKQCCNACCQCSVVAWP